MQTPPEIAFHNLDHSPTITARIEKRLEKLERLFDRIISCRVTVERRHNSHRKGSLFGVSIVLAVPGQQLVVNQTGAGNPAHEDIEVALRDAFEAAERQLADYARRLRGEVKQHEAPQPLPERA